jgi:hypothetical protein
LCVLHCKTCDHTMIQFLTALQFCRPPEKQSCATLCWQQVKD